MYYSEYEEQYYDRYKGHFSKKLAEWAISRMGRLNAAKGEMEGIRRHTIEEWDELIKAHNLRIPDASYYDGYYLWHMAAADYPKALEDTKHVAAFIEETICDPDCEPTAVLACFRAKMDVMSMPIYWEHFL